MRNDLRDFLCPENGPKIEKFLMLSLVFHFPSFFLFRPVFLREGSIGYSICGSKVNCCVVPINCFFLDIMAGQCLNKKLLVEKGLEVVFLSNNLLLFCHLHLKLEREPRFSWLI